MRSILAWMRQNWNEILVKTIVGVVVVAIAASFTGAWSKFDGWMWPKPPVAVNSPASPPPAPTTPLGVQVVVADDVKLPVKNEEAAEVLRQHLRSKSHVRVLLAEESNTRIKSAPRGVWGWVGARDYISSLAYKTLGDPLDRNRIARHRSMFESEVEFQILDTGTIYMIGFVSRDTLTMLKKDENRGREFMFYLDRWGGAPEIVAVPIDQVEFRDMRGIRTEQKTSPFAVSVYDLTTRK